MKIQYSLFACALILATWTGDFARDCAVFAAAGTVAYAAEDADSGAARSPTGLAAIAPGHIAQIRVALPDNLRRFAGAGRLSPVAVARVAVAVPKNFDPAQSWPILVVSATSDPGFNDSGALMRVFLEPALAAGWVIVAADPVQALASPEDDNNQLRFALVKAALAVMKQAWPGSSGWPLAFGGFSGGAKRSGVLALMSTVDGRTPIGVYLAGCNEATPAWALDAYGKPLPEYLRVPVFLSSGRRDTIATPDEHDEVKRQLAAAGFSELRLESHRGSHEVYAPHLLAALQWFAGLHAR